MDFNFDQKIMQLIYYCMVMEYFIKIHEIDDEFNPTKIPFLLTNPKYKEIKHSLENHLILPIYATSKPIQTWDHNYYIAQYPFLPHILTLETITFKAIKQSILNPSSQAPWSSFKYPLMVLNLMKRIMEITMRMYDCKLVDLDTR